MGRRGGGRNYSRNVLLLPAKCFVWVGERCRPAQPFRRRRRGAQPARVEMMLNKAFAWTHQCFQGSFTSPPRATITKAPAENLRKQKTTQMALDNVLGVWPGGPGEGGHPIKTHQPGLSKRKQGTAVKNKDSQRRTDANMVRNCSFYLVLE